MMLSRCQQKVTTEEDIKNNLDRLPLEYRSSEEYYDEIFDTYHYKPTGDWALNVIVHRVERRRLCCAYRYRTNSYSRFETYRCSEEISEVGLIDLMYLLLLLRSCI